MWPFRKKGHPDDQPDTSRKKMLAMEKEVEQLRMMMAQMQEKVTDNL